jgi:deoxyribodipyrimidine photo-lyase
VKQILWFRRDLRVVDNAILSNASGEVLPIFIFDKNILDKLPSNDRRVTFIYQSVQKLKENLQILGLDLEVFYGYPKDIFENLMTSISFDEVLCSCDFDQYAITRDKEIESILHMQRFYDSFLVHPLDTLKKDDTPYKVFTPFYKNLMPFWDCDSITEYSLSKNSKLINYNFTKIPTIESLGFSNQKLPNNLTKSASTLIREFIPQLNDYQKSRDYFALDGTSNLATHLRFGLISPKQVFNKIKKYANSDVFIRQLFWREFYNSILYHFPDSEFKNFNGKSIKWKDNVEHFKSWCDGKTGVPIIDAAMQHLNNTGMMHNRLRMIVASFLTKNLFLPWQWGEEYFALKLLDYEVCSNVGSWQWSASTGADSVPYFRVFNPYAQSEKFDKEGVFTKSVLKDLVNIEPKLLYKENALSSNIFIEYPIPIVDIKKSRQEAINQFTYAK